MRVTSDAKVKRLGDTQPGELIQILSSQEAMSLLAIVLAQNPPKDVLVGCLAPISGFSKEPVYLVKSPSLECISYGTEWVLKPLAGEEFRLDNFEYNGRAGALHLSEEGWSICFATPPSDPHHSEVEFSLSSNSITGHVTCGAPVAHWRVWESSEAYESSEGSYLFEVDLRPRG
jgi:hypothetical protein